MTFNSYICPLAEQLEHKIHVTSLNKLQFHLQMYYKLIKVIKDMMRNQTRILPYFHEKKIFF